MSAYAFDNAGEAARQRYDLLAAVWDNESRTQLERVGVDTGWNCLEVGAGGGSIAEWLGARVGNTGHVLAVDLSTRFLERLRGANIEVREHDLVRQSLPECAFDLVHSRLVLMHLPERDEVLSRLIKSLRPGGWLVLEEFDALSTVPDPTVYPGETSLAAALAMRAVMRERGIDLCYGRRLPAVLRARGLADVRAAGRAFMWHSDSLGARLYRLTLEELRGEILARCAIDDEQFSADLERISQADFAVPSPMLWTVCARSVE
jgi:SAM-dependent methyltransferase